MLFDTPNLTLLSNLIRFLDTRAGNEPFPLVSRS